VLLLVALAALPAFALTFYAGWRDRQHQLAGVSVDTIRLARLVASDQERIIEGTRQILSDLAEVPEVREGDGVKSRRFFGLLMKQYRGYASFSLLDPAGNVLASLPAIQAPLNLSDRTWFRRAVAEKGFALGGYQIGQLTRKAVLVAAWPVVNETGAVTRVIAAALDIEWLNQIAATTQLPAGAMLVVLDRQDRIVARYPDAPHWVGRTVPEADVLSAVRSAPEGFVEAQGHDGAAHIYGFTPVRGRIETGLRLVVGIPREQAYGAITRAQNRQILGLALVAVLTLAAAWFGAERFVLRRVASLLEATRKLAAGDPGARTRLPYGHGELSDLARAFDDMAGAIQARQAERDRAEQALRESEERFRAFMNHSPAIAFVKDQAGVYLYANQAFERALGLDAEAWFGRTDDELWADGTAARLRAADRDVLSTGQPRQEVESFELRDGRAAHWLSVTFPLTDASGRTLLAGTCLDLSEWRQLQEALGRSERRYRNLVDQAPDGIALTDSARRMIAVNTALATLSGYSPEELQERRLDDLLVPGSLDSLPGGLDDLPPGVNAGSACVLRRRDGSTLPAEISAKLLEHGAVQAFLRDVSARHAAEAALRASEERFRRLYHYLPVAYQSLTLDGVIVEVNEAWVGLMGLPRERAIGARFAALLPASSRARLEESLAILPASESLHGVEFTVARAGRAAAIVSVDGRVGQDERGEARVHCVLHDITAARLGATRLAVSEERFRTLFSESPVSLWEEDFSGIKRHIERLAGLGVSDLDAHFAAHPEELADCVETVRVVDVNKATLALYGADSRSQMLAGLDRIVGADGYAVFKNAILALARGDRSWESEGINYTLAGEPIRLALRWSLAPGAEASWSRVLVSAMDVTERRRAEAALRESELRLDRTFRPAPGIMAISSRREGRYVEVNDAFVRELGYPREAVIGRTATELGLWVDPGQRAAIVARLDSRGSLESEEVRLRRQGGAIMDALCSVVPLVVDGEECLLVHVVDITARKRAEEAERESRRILTTLMSNLPGMVYQCCDDPEWTMLFVSEGCRELTGYEPEDLVGNRRVSYGALILEEDRDLVLTEVRQGIAEQRAFRMIYRIRRADGEVRWVWEQGRAVAGADGQATLEGFISGAEMGNGVNWTSCR
jgi:PAS domain S-box-containing protein